MLGNSIAPLKVWRPRGANVEERSRVGLVCGQENGVSVDGDPGDLIRDAGRDESGRGRSPLRIVIAGVAEAVRLQGLTAVCGRHLLQDGEGVMLG